MPEGVIRSLVRLLLWLIYGFRAYNREVLETKGPVLLIPNHVSWIDWLFLGACLSTDWKFVTSSATAETTWLHRRIMVNRLTFPIDMTSPYAVKRMAEFLQKGGRLVLFAEGRISRTGTLMKILDGTGFLLHKTKARVITCYLRGAVRLPYVRHSGWTQWCPRISTHFSAVLEAPEVGPMTTSQARLLLTDWLRDRLVEQQCAVDLEFGGGSVLGNVARMARILPRKCVLEDMTRQQLSYRKLMVGVQVLSQQWRNPFGRDAIERIGVLLPNVNATPVVVLSLWAAGKVPAVLNFSTGMASMLACAQLAGLKRVITSRAFLERAHFDAAVFQTAGLELVFLEDVRSRVSGSDRVRALLRQALIPRWSVSTRHLKPEETAVILFTSGSEGAPKGVELTHRNLMANIRQMLAVIDLEDSDRLFNALPLFHSFGLTIGTLLPLVRGIYVFLYPSPLHYRLIPTAVYDRYCTVMLATNTFLNGYARRANPYDFRALRYLFAGAEKIQESTSAIYMRKFGIRILEGYGATECSPCLSVNTPFQAKLGSAGKFLPGIEHRLEPVEGVAEGGRLWVRGPNLMRGYLNADANQKFQSWGGWYDTGDIAKVDEHGFVFILGRLKRFAKVSGEMVSLTAVEEALAGAFGQFGLRCETAILSRPDEEKGEVLVAVTNEPRLTLDQIRTVLRTKGLSNLVFPRELKCVREIPKLGTGKINHRELERLV